MLLKPRILVPTRLPVLTRALRLPLPLSLSPPSSLPIPNSMIHTLALWRVDRVSNNLSEVWIPVGNHFMWSFRVQVASHPFLFTKTAQVNKLGAIFNLNNCREIHQLKRVTPHEFTYITVDKQAHEICKLARIHSLRKI